MTTIPLCQEQAIRDQIAALKAQLPREPHEPSEPLHAVITKVFRDGATHTRTVDIANEWKKTGHGIREAVRQGGEVVLRPLFPGEEAQEVKEYPSTKRIRALEGALGRALFIVLALRNSGELSASEERALQEAQELLAMDAGKAGAA